MKPLLVVLLSVFTLCANAQDKMNRPNSYNYQRGVEAIQKENTEEALEYLNLQNPLFGRNIKAGGFYKLSVFLHYLCRNPFSLNPDGAHTTKTAYHVHRGITIA